MSDILITNNATESEHGLSLNSLKLISLEILTIGYIPIINCKTFR